MPGEDGALDPRGEFVHTREYRELPDIAVHAAGHDHRMDLIKHFLHLGPGLALDAIRQQRSRCLRYAAAGADKTDVSYRVPFHRQKELQLVATQGIMPLRRASRVRQLVKIARMLAVVEDDLL